MYASEPRTQKHTHSNRHIYYVKADVKAEVLTVVLVHICNPNNNNSAGCFLL